MEISIAGQTIVFLQSIFLGTALAIVYDVFKIIRILTKARAFATAVWDIFYCLLLVLALFGFILIFSEGQSRSYIFLGTILGSILYFMTISRPFVRFTTVFFRLIAAQIGRFWKTLKKICVFAGRKAKSFRKKFKKIKNIFDFFAKRLKINYKG